MSIRYSVTLTLDPIATARVHHIRQLVCNQHAAWAAEMFALQTPVAEFFQCDPGLEGALVERVARLAIASRREAPRFPLPIRGTRMTPGNILLDFSDPARAYPIYVLNRKVLTLLQETPGAAPNPQETPEGYAPGLYLLRAANLPDRVFAEAEEFAQALTERLQAEATPCAWRLQLTRYESGAAGEDWSGGRWAADLRWQILDSFPL